MERKVLREKFDINGYFYQEGKEIYRKYLDIQKKSSKLDTPDLMIIMMNPGSSHPIGTKNFKEIPSELLDRIVQTVPDNTQDQIMRVMLKHKFEYARILNLSDLCDASSGSFYSKLKTLKSKQINHSIFQTERENDFKNLFEYRAKLIVAWGVNNALLELAEKALGKIGNKFIGLKKENKEWAYYHPLPRINQKQIDWIDNIEKQINSDVVFKH